MSYKTFSGHSNITVALFESSLHCPISLRDRKDLQIAKKKDPVYWIWEKDQIKRIKFETIQSREKIS